MGYGEMAGNGSVHWKFDHEDEKGEMSFRKEKGRPKGRHEMKFDGARVMGRDPAPNGIGKKANKKGYFDVRLRFASRVDAERELKEALEQGKEDDGYFFVHVDVKAADPTNDPDKAPAEVRVDW
jgi:hypothetical protein